jgi:uncharacterized protein with FMN-binding domain
MKRSLPLLLGLGVVAATTFPGTAHGSAPAAATATARKVIRRAKKKATAVTTRATAATVPTELLSIPGPVIDTRWGPVQVTIDVKAKHIVDVRVPVFPNEKRRSMMINQNALPQYHDEAIVAQSASIANVSGATYTFEGYSGSLQGAIDTAKAQGAL